MTTPTGNTQQRSAAAVRWLKEANQTLLAWAASLTWTRLFVLCLIVLIASSWIADTLELRHERPSVTIDISDEAPAPLAIPVDQTADCQQPPVRIDEQKYLLVCEKKDVAIPVSPPSGTTAPGTATGKIHSKVVHKSVPGEAGRTVGVSWETCFRPFSSPSSPT
jgi:hypothetical protein